MSKIIAMPQLRPCSWCGHEFAGAICHVCKEEVPAYSALKAKTSREHCGVQPLRDPKFCTYSPKSICDCGFPGSGICLSAA